MSAEGTPLSQTLLSLAERVERASGADRELDALIWCLINGYEVRWTGVRCELMEAVGEGIIGWIDPGGHRRNFSTSRSTTGPASIPAYTASLDAAMTLAENYNFSLDRIGSECGAVVNSTPFTKTATIANRCVTPALALTAAALRTLAKADAPAQGGEA